MEQNVTTNIVATANFSSLTAQLASVTSQLTRLQETTIGLNKNLGNQIAVMNRSFADTMGATGQFSRHFVTLSSDVEKFGKNLDSGKMKLGQYFNTWQSHTKKTGGLIRDLAKQQVMLENAVLQPLGKNAQGLMQYNVMVGKGLNEVANKTAIVRHEAQILNKVMQDGANQLINWGKNTQWAGRQLTVGLTVPLVAFGASAAKAFREADQELVRLTKVYGGLTATSSQELAKVRKDVSATARELSSAYGASYKDTIALAADIAATGKEGQDLLKATQQTTRLSILGEVDRQEAMKATLAIQNAFKQNTTELAQSIDFLNAVENQTSTTLQDLVEAIPKAGPVIEGMGGSIKDLALYMTAMKEGGVNAAEGANALKSSIASLINPTKVAKEMFAGFGIDLSGIVTKNAGNLTGTILELQSALDKLNPLQKQQALEQLFGKFQFARMNALFSNLGKQGSQTLKVLDLMKASSKELADISGRELTQVTESASGKYKRALESVKADLAIIGNQFLTISTYVLKAIDGIVKFFQNIPDPIKKVLAFAGGFTALVGPLIMLTGVLGNFFGYIVKGIYHFKSLFKGAEGFKLLTPEIVAAQKAGSALEQQFYSDAKATAVLSQSVQALAASFAELQAKALAAATTTGPAISTLAGSPIASSGVIGREVNKNSQYLGAPYSREMSHQNPVALMSAEERAAQTIFGVTPGTGPVNKRVGKRPQIYMTDDLARINGVTAANGVSTGVVASEAAKWHAMTATLAMQSKQDIALLKKEIATTGAVTSDFMHTYDDILPQMSGLTEKAARESALIVAELQAGKITASQATTKIMTLNAQIETMMAETAAATAAAQGRVVNLTTVPLTSQPVVDAVTGKSNMKEMFHKSSNAALIDKIALSLGGVKTSGGSYSIETTRPIRRHEGGKVYDPEKHGNVVPGDTSINYDNTPAVLREGGYVLNQEASRNNPDLVSLAVNQHNPGGQIVPALLTPGETYFPPEQAQAIMPMLEKANGGAKITLSNTGGLIGGSVSSNQVGYGTMAPSRALDFSRFEAINQLLSKAKTTYARKKIWEYARSPQFSAGVLRGSAQDIDRITDTPLGKTSRYNPLGFRISRSENITPGKVAKPGTIIFGESGSEFTSLNGMMANEGVRGSNVNRLIKNYLAGGKGMIKGSTSIFLDKISQAKAVDSLLVDQIKKEIHSDYIRTLMRMKRSGISISDANNPYHQVSSDVIGRYANENPELKHLWNQFKVKTGAVNSHTLNEMNRGYVSKVTGELMGGAGPGSNGVRNITLVGSDGNIIKIGKLKGSGGENTSAYHAVNKDWEESLMQRLAVGGAVTAGKRNYGYKPSWVSAPNTGRSMFKGEYKSPLHLSQEYESYLANAHAERWAAKPKDADGRYWHTPYELDLQRKGKSQPFLNPQPKRFYQDLSNDDPAHGAIQIGRIQAPIHVRNQYVGAQLRYRMPVGQNWRDEGFNKPAPVLGTVEERAKSALFRYMQGDYQAIGNKEVQQYLSTIRTKFTGRLHRGVDFRTTDSLPPFIKDLIKAKDWDGLIGQEFIMRRASWSKNPDTAKGFGKGVEGKGYNQVVLVADVKNRNAVPASEIFPDLTFQTHKGPVAVNESEVYMGGKFRIVKAGQGELKLQAVYDKQVDGKREHGGPVNENRPYLVGEKGPEIFVPKNSGGIIPHYALGGIVKAIKHGYGNDAPIHADSFSSKADATKAARSNDPARRMAGQAWLASYKAKQAAVNGIPATPVSAPPRVIKPGPYSVGPVGYTGNGGVAGRAYAPMGSLPYAPGLTFMNNALNAPAKLFNSLKSQIGMSLYALGTSLKADAIRIGNSIKVGTQRLKQSLIGLGQDIAAGARSAAAQLKASAIAMKQSVVKFATMPNPGLTGGMGANFRYGQSLMLNPLGFGRAQAMSWYPGRGAKSIGMANRFGNMLGNRSAAGKMPLGSGFVGSMVGMTAGSAIGSKLGGETGALIGSIGGMAAVMAGGKAIDAIGARRALMAEQKIDAAKKLREAGKAQQAAAKQAANAAKLREAAEVKRAAYVAEYAGKGKASIVTPARYLAGKEVESAFKLAAAAEKGVGPLTKQATALGRVAANAKVATPALKVVGGVLARYVPIVGEILSIGQALWVWKRHAEDVGKANRAVFGPTEKSLKEVGLKYVSLTSRLKDYRKQLELSRTAALASITANGKTGVAALTLTVDELRKGIKDAKENAKETVQDFNKTYGKEDVLKLATSLKQQYISAGMSVQEATNKIYVLMKASNKGAYALDAITSKQFKAITDQASSATYAIDLVGKAIASGKYNSEEVARGVENVVNSMDAYKNSLVGTKDAAGNIITETQALGMALKKIQDSKFANNKLDEKTLETIKAQNLELGLVLRKEETLAGVYAKTQLLQNPASVHLDIYSMSSETATTVAQGMQAYDSAVDSVVAKDPKLGALVKKAKDLGAAYQNASKAAQGVSTVKYDLVIKAQEKIIKGIEKELAARLKVLDAQQQQASFQTEMAKLQLAYQNALASGDMQAAAEAQLNLQQLTKDNQIAIAKQAAQDKADADKAKAQAIIDKANSAKEGIQVSAQNAGQNAANALADQSSLQAFLTTIENQTKSIVPGEELSKTDKATIQVAIREALDTLKASGKFGADWVKANEASILGKDKGVSYVSGFAQTAGTEALSGKFSTAVDKFFDAVVQFSGKTKPNGKETADGGITIGTEKPTEVKGATLKDAWLKAQNTRSQQHIVDGASYKIFEYKKKFYAYDTQSPSLVYEWDNNKGEAGKKVSLSGARAAGGRMLTGGSYLVGENGPEIYKPTMPGYMIPNNKINGPSYDVPNNNWMPGQAGAGMLRPNLNNMVNYNSIAVHPAPHHDTEALANYVVKKMNTLNTVNARAAGGQKKFGSGS